MDIVCVFTLLAQRLPRNTRSGCEACTRFSVLKYPMGKTVTPLSETVYIMSPLAVRTDLPAVFSARFRFHWTARLSAATTCRIGGATEPCGADGEGDVGGAAEHSAVPWGTWA